MGVTRPSGTQSRLQNPNSSVNSSARISRSSTGIDAGFLWSLANPLILVVYTFVFTVVFKSAVYFGLF